MEPSFRYCPQCSQVAIPHRLTMRELAHEAVHYFTHADKGIFQLIRDLAVEGGEVARNYVEGQRKRFFPPLNFFLIVAAIHVFVLNHGGDVEVNSQAKQHLEVQQIKDPIKRERLMEVYHRKDVAIEFVNKYANIISMLTLPLTTFFFWLLYRKGKYNYTENLVACMYMHSFVLLMFSIILQINGLFFEIDPNPIYAVFLTMQISYSSWFYYHFQDNKGTSGALKALASSFISLGSLFLINFVLVGIYMLKIFE